MVFNLSWYSHFKLISLHLFFYTQLVYKQLALGWQIAKQLSGLNPLSLSNNKNYRLKKVKLFLCNKCKIAVKRTIHQNSVASKAILGKLENHWSWRSISSLVNHYCTCRHRLLGQTTKQTLSNFEPQKPW